VNRPLFLRKFSEKLLMPNESIDQVSEKLPVSTTEPERLSHPAPGGSRLRKNIAALSVLQLLNYALPIAVVPYLVRVLGPAHYGLLVFAQAAVNYANSVTDYGFNYSATRLVARHREDRAALSRIFWSTITAKSILMLLCFAALAVLITLVPMFRAQAALLAACSLLVLGNVLFPMWFFQGMEEMRAITIAQAIAKMSLIPLVFLFVKNQDHFVRAAALQSGTTVLAGIIGLPLLSRVADISWYRPSKRDILESFREGWDIFISTVAITIYTSTNTLVLGFVSGEAQVGYFGAANRIINGSQGVLIPVSQALYPHLNSMAVKSREAAVALIRKSLFWIGLISISASLAFLLGAAPISHLALGRKFDGSITPLRWMALLPVLLGLSNVFGVQTMLTFGMNKEFNRIVTTSAVINLLLTFPFAYWWGATGAAIAVVLTEVFVTAAMFFKVKSMGLLASTPISGGETK
jgi:PST family polysaccharide transporter